MGTLATADKDLYFTLGLLATMAGGIYWWSRSEDAGPGELVAECSDGSVIGFLRGQVRRRPGRTGEQRAKMSTRHPGLESAELRELLTDDLVRGSLSFARVRAGVRDEAAWVLEGLNPERDEIRVRWEFESVEIAERVRKLLEDCVVRAPLDAKRTPVSVSEADLDAVRARERAEEERPAPLGVSPGTGGRLHAT